MTMNDETKAHVVGLLKKKTSEVCAVVREHDLSLVCFLLDQHGDEMLDVQMFTDFLTMLRVSDALCNAAFMKVADSVEEKIVGLGEAEKAVYLMGMRSQLQDICMRHMKNYSTSFAACMAKVVDGR